MAKASKNYLYRMKELNRFKTMIARLSTEDFDGHTDFTKLSSEQRLYWLSCCAYFVDQIKKENAETRTLLHKPQLGILPNSVNNSQLPL